MVVRILVEEVMTQYSRRTSEDTMQYDGLAALAGMRELTAYRRYLDIIYPPSSDEEESGDEDPDTYAHSDHGGEQPWDVAGTDSQ